MLALNRGSEVSIKSVGPFDLGRLARLHRSCFEEGWSRSDLAHLLAMPGTFGLLARLFDGRLGRLDAMRGVGFCLCRLIATECELLSIGVLPDYRQRGIGRDLLRAAMERCLRAGANTMFLEVAVENRSAQRLYEQHGFRRVGLRPDYYQHADGSRSSAYTMRCDLLEVCATPPAIRD